jgi:hypothetical protein
MPMDRNAVVTNINYDTGLFDIMVFDFLNKYKNDNVNNKKIEKIYIDNKNLDSFKLELSNNSYIYHDAPDLFYFYSDNVLGKFERNNNGLDDGIILYINQLDADIFDNIISKVSDNSTKISIRWYLDGDGDYADVIELYNDIMYDSMYPFIDGGICKYIDNFLKSKSSILVLIGQPGTGKSSFIRYILSRMDKKAYLTYNHEIFKNDLMFSKFVTNSTSGAFVIEDADVLLKSRESGNELMQKFLQLGEGVIKLNGKKLIFSTNLPSTKDIDEALIRKGRCHDVLEFRPLTFEEANRACEDLKLEKLTDNREYKLTEIFNRDKVKEQKKVGFY